MTAHKHAERMVEYGQDALKSAEPWKEWQQGRKVQHEDLAAYVWEDCANHPSWRTGFEYRRKPRTVTFCGQELPAPETEAPEYGTPFYLVNLKYPDSPELDTWDSDAEDRDWLGNGLVHLPREHAQQWGKAIATAMKGAIHD